MRNVVFALLALLAVVTSASAQTAPVKNPSTLIFEVSPDHDHPDALGYEADIVRTTDDVVIQTINVGRPTPDANRDASVPINVQPVAFGEYYVVLRFIAVSPTGVRTVSENSERSNTWQRVAGPPRRPRLQ